MGLSIDIEREGLGLERGREKDPLLTVGRIHPCVIILILSIKFVKTTKVDI